MNNDKKIESMLLKYALSLETLETELRVMIKNYEYENNCSKVENITSRIKSVDSIKNKLKRKNYEYTPENIANHLHDVIGIRVVCTFISDVYDIIALIKNNIKYKIKEEKDYIATPKETGYISYHIIILVPIILNGKETFIEAEIQVRTKSMDYWASLDHKILYKFDKMPEELKKEMYKLALQVRRLDKKMYRLKVKADNYKKN